MKRILVVLFLGAALGSARAQDTFQFAANLPPLHPDLGSPSGFGVFTLDGSTFRYRVDVLPFGPVWDSQIRGPGPDGPLLFDLPVSGCVTPIGTNLGSCWFRGTVEVPDLWIADLMANRWYLVATYHVGSFEESLRGQIVLVPEPSPLLLVGAFGGVLGLYSFLRAHRMGKPAAFPPPSQGAGVESTLSKGSEIM